MDTDRAWRIFVCQRVGLKSEGNAMPQHFRVPMCSRKINSYFSHSVRVMYGISTVLRCHRGILYSNRFITSVNGLGFMVRVVCFILVYIDFSSAHDTPSAINCGGLCSLRYKWACFSSKLVSAWVAAPQTTWGNAPLYLLINGFEWLRPSTNRLD